MNKAMNQLGLIGLSMVVACMGVMIAATARASTSATAYYQLGEVDAGSPSDGSPGDTMTVDSSGHGFNLTKSGSPTYSDNVPSGIGSTLSMEFSPSDSYSRPNLIQPGVDPVIIEAWANPTAADLSFTEETHVVVSSGDFVICIYREQWSFLEQGNLFNLGGLVAVDPDSDNNWVDLKLVLDNGTLTGYINGLPVTTSFTETRVPSTVSGAFAIGGDFTGDIDDVTVIAPEPASLGLLAIGGVMLLRRRRA